MSSSVGTSGCKGARSDKRVSERRGGVKWVVAAGCDGLCGMDGWSEIGGVCRESEDASSARSNEWAHGRGDASTTAKTPQRRLTLLSSPNDSLNSLSTLIL